jgi:hypothetical protein
VRCPRCGNENQATNRFCGMCGATLLQTPVGSSDAIPAPAPPAAKPPVAPSPTTRANAPAPEETPIISGPSFLGLNEPSPAKSSGKLSLDPGSLPPSRSLDYLLDDDDAPRQGGAGKWILMFVALALAVGFGYLHWKNQGFSWLNSGEKKPAAAAPSDGEDANASTPAAGAPAPGSATNSSAAGSGSQPAPNSPVSPAPNPTASNTPAATTAPAPTSVPAAIPPANVPASSSAPASAGDADSSASVNAPAVNKGSNDTADSPAEAPSSKPAPAPVTKPTPVVRPTPVDPVLEAQKYIYGKGARQDCDRGLRLLKPAADQSNTKAMIEMGALYSAGLCTPHDLPTAYRWFALALRKDPDNESVQSDLQKLWSEMTQPERQLAIKLSQ